MKVEVRYGHRAIADERHEKSKLTDFFVVVLCAVIAVLVLLVIILYGFQRIINK